MFRKGGKTIIITIIVAASMGIFGGLSYLIYDSVSMANAKKNDREAISELANDYLTDNRKTVLIISSFDSMMPAAVQEINGVTEVLLKNLINFDVEYMDALVFPTEENEKLFYNLLKHRMLNHAPYDAVLAFGDPALKFVRTYRDDLFDDHILFFADVTNPELAVQSVRDFGISGILKTDTFDKTLKFAMQLIPDAKKIVALTDDTPVGNASLSALSFAARDYTHLPFEVINASKYSFNELVSKLRSVESDSIFIFLGFSTDKNGKRYSIADSYKIASKYVTNAPMFSATNGVAGRGILGGSVYDFRKAGELAGIIISKGLLDGVNISCYGVISDFGSYNFIDHEILEKFGFDKRLVDLQVTVIDKNIALARTKIIIPFIIISISLMVLLLISSILYVKANRAQILVNLRNKAIGRKNKLLKESEERFKRMSQYDFLTSIPNRSFADREINACFKKNLPFSIFHIDIDGFKNFNDYYTHDCGDFVLKEISSRLSYLSEQLGCFVARYGGDEFLLIYTKGCLENGSPDFALIKSVMNKSCVYKNLNLDLTISGGVANYIEGISFDELASNADLAMYEAKKRGKGNICFFRPEMKDEIVEKNRISKMLEHACAEKLFSILYQPQIDTMTGKVCGYEALVRLNGDSVPPSKFIPVAEESGYITTIGRIVIEKVISQMAQWRLEGMEIKKVAVNYSIGQLVDLDYVDYLDFLLKKYDISPKFVEIEITETLLMENKKLARTLFDSLAKIGVGLVLDDFGTGYSSLSYLTYLPAKKVKIDKSLIDNYLIEGKESFISNIVRLVHDLGMELTIEGVEQQWQYDLLRTLKCDYIQGYYFSKPIPGEDVAAFVPDVAAS